MDRIQKTIYIQGMHCASCEMLIKLSSEAIKGVKVRNISSSRGEMDIEMPDDQTIAQIRKAIEEAGYKMLDGKPEEDKKNIRWTNILLSLAIVGILAVIFSKLDIISYLPSMGGKLSYGLAIVMGLIASVSTCLAIVGSVVIGFTEYADKENGTKDHVRTQLAFHAGRIGGFFLLGGLLGLLGEAITLSLTMTTILTIIVGIVVLRMGLHLLGILPNISSLGAHLPKKRSEKTLTTKNPAFAPLIGMLTFFLPCGFTLSMQLIAINTGRFVEGGLAMALFALGTAPVLFALGVGSSYIKEKRFALLHSIIGTMIVFFGIFMIMNGRHLLGGTSGREEHTNTMNSSGTYERIEIGHDGSNTVPEIITLNAGKNYELVITPTDNGKGCMSTLTIPGLDRSIHPIIKGNPITYRLSNIKKGAYTIICGTMGMYQGKIIVE